MDNPHRTVGSHASSDRQSDDQGGHAAAFHQHGEGEAVLHTRREDGWNGDVHGCGEQMCGGDAFCRDLRGDEREKAQARMADGGIYRPLLCPFDVFCDG